MQLTQWLELRRKNRIKERALARAKDKMERDTMRRESQILAMERVHYVDDWLERKTMQIDMDNSALEQADRRDELESRRQAKMFNWSDDEGA